MKIRIWILLQILLTGTAFAQTWNSDIACIIYSHCSSCHREGGIAPFSLMSHFEASQRKEMIASSVQSKMMPPFPPDQTKRPLAHANTLNQNEIDAIVSWANNNAPLGSGPEPTAPAFSSAWEIENADLVKTIPSYTVNTPQQDDYRVFVLPIGNTQTKYIESVEVVPGNREIVHHVLVYKDTSAIPYQLDQADPLPGYAAFGSTGSSSAELVAGYVPGQKAYSFPPGFGSRLLPNSYLCLQIHYPKGVNNQADSTSVRIRYRNTAVREMRVEPILNHTSTLMNGPLFIPAGSVKTFYSQFISPGNYTLTGLAPHMHLLGKRIRAYGIKPGGDTIHLIDIPDWHFHWQGFYSFKKPVLIPAGTVLKGEAVYDNTSDNPENPNIPPQPVSLGEGTSDEMMLIYFVFAPYLPGDSSIVIDSSDHFTHNEESCTMVTSTEKKESPQETGILIFPNPVNEVLSIEGICGPFQLRIRDGLGCEARAASGTNSIKMDLRKLPTGLYHLEIETRDGVFHKSLWRRQ